MVTTRHIISQHMKLVDVVLELADARLPRSSYINITENNAPCVIALTKSELADAAESARWISHFAKNGKKAVLIDSIKGYGVEQLKQAISAAAAPKLAREKEKGMRPRAIKLMVVGIPNVGKSTFINKLSGRAAARVGDRPGVTRNKQWIKLKGGYELLDTPGILLPKQEEAAMLHLAITGAVKDEVVDITLLAAELCSILQSGYPQSFAERYKLNVDELMQMQQHEIMEAIGKSRGFLAKGGVVDIERTASILLDEFRAAKLGRITLEQCDKPEDTQE